MIGASGPFRPGVGIAGLTGGRAPAAAGWVSRRRRRLLAVGGAVLLFVVLGAIALLEGDFPEEFTHVRALARFALSHYGAAGAFALLYGEESGIPLPVPGDVYVAFLGRLAGGDVVRWLAAWLGIIAVVVAGSSNLYLLSRRWGRKLLERPLAAALHLDPSRLASAERWFARWGPITIIFGRHIPGLRVPITVAAGVSRVPYGVFAPSVAVSTAAWAAIWLWLGGRYGPAVGRFFGLHGWAFGVVTALVILVVAVTLVRAWRKGGGR